MDISIYILCYNEELFIAFAINFYKQRFPKAVITILDNLSTDNTVAIARSLGCEIYSFDTQGKISDLMYQYLKNNHWKKAVTSNWTIVADCDELLDICEGDLVNEICTGTTLIRGEGWNMVNMNNDLNIAGIDHGYRDNDVLAFYDKWLMFDKSKIQEINYIIGAHSARPHGQVNFSKKAYKLYHYKYINPDFMVQRYKMYAERLSDENRANNWGKNYEETEGTIRALFEVYRQKSSKII